MFKKLLSLSLVALLINLGAVTPAYAASKEEKQARFAEKVKASVLKFGTGETARVKIKLQDKTKVAGYISAADGEGFTVVDPKTGTATTIAYPQVKSVQGHNLSTGAKIAIGVGIVAAIIFIILWYTTGPGSD
jgi:preprotein translocase subunit SecF